MLALIGGSGLYGLEDSDGLLDAGPIGDPSGPWGEPSGPVVRFRSDSGDLLFIARHGPDHSVAPHLVNYRANLDALARSGATRILAVCTVGAIDPAIDVGSLVLPDQVIDYTWGREQTFHSPGGTVSHVDFTEPYDPHFRSAVGRSMDELAIPFTDGGTYGAAQGPRFESAAEVGRMARDGCAVVGMTGMPEAGLARELDIPYAALCPVGNRAAGTGGGPIEFGEVRGQAAKRNRTILDVALRLLAD